MQKKPVLRQRLRTGFCFAFSKNGQIFCSCFVWHICFSVIFEEKAGSALSDKDKDKTVLLEKERKKEQTEDRNIMKKISLKVSSARIRLEGQCFLVNIYLLKI